jgi:UDP-4-amino-4,6-dideoxy-N-acetyl-beta-L-altrosamine transaminase
MTDSFLPYGRQTIDEDDIAAVVDVLRSDFLTTGPAVKAFETSLSNRMNQAEVVSCSSGTAALHLATLALGLGPGDWAIVPAITFLATANAVRYTGADVIFCDVDPETGLMSAGTFEAALVNNVGKNIRAVFPVHLAGQPADPVGIAAIARREGISIVEDACHALGTYYPEPGNGPLVPLGACVHADMSVFSFHPVKIIACGEGGAISTNDQTLADRLRSFRNNGMTRKTEDFQHTDLAFDVDGTVNPWYYEMSEPGFNYRLSDINAALGLSQLAKMDAFAERRRKLVSYYDEQLQKLAPTMRPTRRSLDCEVAWHLYQVLIDFPATGKSRATLMNELRAKGIGSQVHYIPVSSQPYYRQLYGEVNLPGVESFYSHTLSLPLLPSMIETDVTRVVMALGECLEY